MSVLREVAWEARRHKWERRIVSVLQEMREGEIRSDTASWCRTREEIIEVRKIVNQEPQSR